ncbi:MAG: SAM-dependent chlorinase/fluorinase [Caldilineales bacterium]|nr:SAM-dependent chlorinase/fluorinase [Caldilineales bacterium]MDW8318983.1 SAM-dependent chlorinase/fluorinase [Anaerolineae bacterium]
MTIITLTTDFGLDDGYVGAMKGVILGIAPGATLVDITHALPPQDIRRGVSVLREATPYFPAGTVHLAIVDPGVGSQRRPIALQAGAHRFVGPDNGLFTAAIADAQAAGLPVAVYHLDRPAYWRPEISRTFHGRDIFAPVAAHLANGVPLEELGTPVDDPVLLPLWRPERRPDGRILGHVDHVDHFGNLISNVPGAWLAGRRWTISIAGRQLVGPRPTYAAAEPGELLALISSSGHLEVAVRNGSAAALLGVQAGEPIEVWEREE